MAKQAKASGGDLLRKFLEEHGLKPHDAASALKVGRSSIHYWINGEPPNAVQRARIERWTSGLVPADSWLSHEDRKAIAGVVPFSNQRTGS